MLLLAAEQSVKALTARLSLAKLTRVRAQHTVVTNVARWQWLPYGEVLSDMAMEVWWQLHTKSTKEGKRSTGLLTRTTNVSHNPSSQLHSLHQL